MELPQSEIPALDGLGALEYPAVDEDEPACVLIIDDTPGKLLSLCAVVGSMGLEVCTASSGRDALRQMLARDFALILLDVNMPVMDGYETAQLIHGRPRSAHTPIIFITAEAASDDARARAYTAGAADWIYSPVIPEILKAKITVLVNLYHLARVAQRQAELLRLRAGEIERQNAELEEASRVKSRFLACMSHELRTPLNAIIGFSALLKDGLIGSCTDKQKVAAVNIFNSGKHLLDLINDILDLSKVEAGQMTLETEAAALEPMLDGAMVVVREKALERRIRLQLTVAPDLGAMLVDVRKVRQILFNLLSNAVKFTPDNGAVSVAARRVPRKQVGDGAAGGRASRILELPPSEFEEFLEIQVSDSGVGLAEPDMRRLFNSFVQLDSTITRNSEGTGLGLALVRQLAALHGGTVGVISELGKGSTFVVWLPWRSADAAAPAPPQPARAAPPQPVATAAHAAPDAQPLALVIEDDQNAATILATQLESIGFRVQHASDAETGLAMAAREAPALITLDLLLPGQNGWEALERIKGDPQLCAIPIVIVSVAEELGQGYALGAVEVLQKPVQRDALLTLVNALGLGGAPRRPLVFAVHDDPDTLELLARELAAIDCDVVRAQGGQEATELARRLMPDLVILDLIAHTTDAFDVIEALKGRSETADVPVLLLTATADSEADRERLTGYITEVARQYPVPGGGLRREAVRVKGRGNGGAGAVHGG